MIDLFCPYCDAGLEVCHDDGFGYEEGVAHEMECPECEKNFTFQTSISFDYSESKADCLNGSPHPFGEWRKIWDHDGKLLEDRCCRTCDHKEQRTTPVEKGVADE